MGDIRLGAAAYERVLRMDPDNLEAWMHLAQARKEVHSVVLPPSHSLILFCSEMKMLLLFLLRAVSFCSPQK